MRLRSGALTRIGLQLAIDFSPIEAVWRKTLQDVNRDSEAKPDPKKFRKKLYVSQNQWAGCPERLVRRQLIQRRLGLFFGCDSDGGFFGTHR